MVRMMGAPPSFDFWPDRYIGSTLDFTIEHHGAYLLLLMHQWQRGHLPSDIERLMRVCGVHSSDHWDKLWEVVGEKFELIEDCEYEQPILVNLKMHADREFAMKNWRFEKAKAKPKLTREELSMIRSDAGKQGGRPVIGKPKKANGKQNKSKTKQIEKKEEGRGKREEGRRKEEEGKGGAVASVVAHYKNYHQRSRPGKKETKLIGSRLAEGYSVGDLISAIDGCHRSPYHCGDNESGSRYQSLELIVRDAKHVQQFLEVAPPIAALSKTTRRTIAAGNNLLGKFNKQKEANSWTDEKLRISTPNSSR